MDLLQGTLELRQLVAEKMLWKRFTGAVELILKTT
jgi:hypothetical protein